MKFQKSFLSKVYAKGLYLKKKLEKLRKIFQMKSFHKRKRLVTWNRAKKST